MKSIIIFLVAVVYAGLAYWFKVDTELAAVTMWGITVALAFYHVCFSIYFLLPVNMREALRERLFPQSGKGE